MVRNLPRCKDTPLSSYLAHLYHSYELLREEELLAWESQVKIMQYGGSASDSDPDIPDHPQPTHLEVQRVGSRRKTTPRVPEDSPGRSKRGRVGEAEPLRSLAGMDSLLRILEAFEELREILQEQDNSLEEIAGLVGCADRTSLLKSVKEAIGDRQRIARVENENVGLQRECSRLRVRNRKCETLVEEAQARANASARALIEVKESLNLSTDIANKARLFNAKLDREDHVSKSRIIRFLVDQAQHMDQALDQIRVLVGNMTVTSPKVTTEGTQTPDFNLEAIPDMTPTRMGQNSEMTPDSRKGKGKAPEEEGSPFPTPPPLPTGADWIDLDVPTEEEISRADDISGTNPTPPQFRRHGPVRIRRMDTGSASHIPRAGSSKGNDAVISTPPPTPVTTAISVATPVPVPTQIPATTPSTPVTSPPQSSLQKPTNEGTRETRFEGRRLRSLGSREPSVGRK